jgi:hypothetical protein
LRLSFNCGQHRKKTHRNSTSLDLRSKKPRPVGGLGKQKSQHTLVTGHQSGWLLNSSVHIPL